jgi:hypothetical protein
MSDPEKDAVGPRRLRQPASGLMREMITIAPEVDPTEPTCPDWEAYAERKYGPNSRLGRMWARLVERENQRRSEE